MTVYATQSSHSAAEARTPARGASAGRAAHGRRPDLDEGYELFRRAIMLRDDEAWLEISLRYRPMLIGWATQLNDHTTTFEQCDDIADRAFARAWSALSAERFGQFPNLPALLGYLPACVSATTIDSARSQNARERAYRRLEAGATSTPEEQVLSRLEQAELWNIAISAVSSEQERVVLIESFQLELAPREILARHPALFADIKAVYLAKRHLMVHLQRCAELRQFAATESAAQSSL